MKKEPVITHSKIIAFVIFISAALITSLFVYHASHKQPVTNLANGQATIFPAGREIKPFELTDSHHQPFTEKQLKKHWTLLFFGFTHCASICPTTLGTLKQAYEKLHTRLPELQVVFISLDPERDSFSKIEKFTQSFNADFIGATAKLAVLRKLQSQFGIFSTRDTNSAKDNYQLQHTPSILLINPKGEWVAVMHQNITPDELSDAVMKSVETHA